MSKILIVEDDPNLLEGYELIFRKEAYTVAVASNGQEGLDMLEKDMPDLVILDMMMPLMSGLEFLERLDKVHNYPNLKIIVFSNMSEPGGTKVAMDLGADRYVTKSTFTPKELIALTKEVLGQTPPPSAAASE